MKTNFIYNIPTKVYFGENKLSNLGKEVKKYGMKVLLTYGGGSIKKSGLYDNIMKELKSVSAQVFELEGIEPNPRHTSVNRGAEICKKENIDVLIAVGGGSVIDCTKAISLAAFYEGDSWDIVLKKANPDKALPIITVLTLAATGSEMDSSAVISNIETEDKLAIASSKIQPKVSFLDPTLTYSVNPYLTACGGADILSHVIEVYFNMNGNLYMLDCFMEGLMKTVIKYTPIAMKAPNNYEARANLMWASSWAINGFIDGGNNQPWSCHPIEHELSAYYDITHGLGLAIITPRWMEYTLDDSTVSRFYQFGVNVFDIDKDMDKMQVAKLAIKELEKFLYETLELNQKLSEIGIDDSKFDIMSQKASEGGTKHGFKPLFAEDINEILKMSL